MNKINIALLLSMLCIVIGCSKKKDSGTPAPKPDGIIYTVNNLSDITIKQYQHDTTVYCLYSIVFESGTQEAVTMAIDSLPDGVTVEQSSVTGTPTFGAQFTFKLNMRNAGTFPVVFKTSSASSATKKFRFNVIVTPVTRFVYAVTYPDIHLVSGATAGERKYAVFSINYSSGPLEPVYIVPISNFSGPLLALVYQGGFTPTTTDSFTIRVDPATPPGIYPFIMMDSTSQGRNWQTLNVTITDH